MALRDLQVIGYDGTNNGIITRIERKLRRPSQWFVCMLHANEFLLRHLLLRLDEETSCPGDFSSPFEKVLSCYEKLPIVKFFLK